MSQVQYKLRHHDLIRENFDGNLFGVDIPALSAVVKKQKVDWYTAFNVTDMGLLKTKRSRHTIVFLNNCTTGLSFFLLAFMTLYIFLYVVRLNDNTVSVGVLYGLLFAESLNVFFVGPILLLLLNAMIPALAAFVLYPAVVAVFKRKRQILSEDVTHRKALARLDLVPHQPDFRAIDELESERSSPYPFATGIPI
jgi:hypothetical protein